MGADKCRGKTYCREAACIHTCTVRCCFIQEWSFVSLSCEILLLHCNRLQRIDVMLWCCKVAMCAYRVFCHPYDMHPFMCSPLFLPVHIPLSSRPTMHPNVHKLLCCRPNCSRNTCSLWPRPKCTAKSKQKNRLPGYNALLRGLVHLRTATS